MAIQGEGSAGDLFKALDHIGQGAGPQDLRLVVADQSQGDPKQDLRTLVEQTIPDPQNSLDRQRGTRQRQRCFF